MGVVNIEVITDKYQPRVEAKTGYFNLVLTTNGDLYGAGYNSSGELGLGHNTNPQITPQVISASSYGNKRILEIDATHFLTVMLTDDGVVYTWGRFAGYALGNTNSYNVPTAIPASSFNNKYIVKVDSGIHCAAYLAQDGTVYTTSQSTSYRGTSSGSANLSSPTAVDTTGVLNGKFITEIQCVDQQSVVMLSSDKLLFGFGKNSFGELGQNNTTSSDTPISLTFPSVNDPAKIAHKMSRGIYVIDSAGDLYYAGSNTSGQAGLNSTTNITVFTKINSADYGSQTIDSITSSLAETFLYTSSGSIYGTGRNHKNQLALGDPDTTDRLTFQLVPTAQFSGKTPSFAATNGWALRVIFTDGYHGVIGDNWSERHMVGISDNPITPFTIVGNTGSGELNLGTHSAITAPAYWLDATQNMANFSITWSSYELDYAAVL